MLQQIEIQLREASQKLVNTNEKISGAVRKLRKVEQKQEAIAEKILYSKKELSNGRRELGQLRYWIRNEKINKSIEESVSEADEKKERLRKRIAADWSDSSDDEFDFRRIRRQTKP